LDSELAEIIDNLRTLGTDVADVEAKRAETKLPASVRDTLSSFANTSGGVLILGLDESRGFEPTGIRDPAKMATDLASCCAEMVPRLRPLIKIHQFESAVLIVAEIEELSTTMKPCFYHGAGMHKGSFVRVNDGDHRLSSYEIQMLLAKRGQPREDEEPVPDTSVDDLDPELIAEFLARLRNNRPHSFAQLDRLSVLRRTRVLVEDSSGSLVVSLGGLLALGRDPQYRFPQLRMTFVYYPTVSGADVITGQRFIDNVVLEGPIPAMVRDGLITVRRNMARRAVVIGPGREDIWEYPEPAFREAIVNALVHRDLSAMSRGTPVQIEMYPNRLLVRNAGGLFGSVTIDRLGDQGVSSTRNTTLMQILEDVPIPGQMRTVSEGRGSGIRTMIDSLRASHMSSPQFTDRISTFQVTFPNHTLLNNDLVTWINSLGEHGLSDSQCLSLAALRKGELLDNQSYRAASGLDSQVARAELRDLVARELVVQTGSRRWTRYQLAPGLDQPVSGAVTRPHRRADRRADVLAALGTDALTRSELAQRTQLTNATVTHWLRVLRREGSVETTEEAARSPHVRYRRTNKIALDDEA
jgi:ATP-dependent DNA helicase RecG